MRRRFAPALAVIAKSPQPGRSKTRLCPPLSPVQAAGLAEAALADTLTAVAAVPVPRRAVILDGPQGPWLPTGIDVIPQRGAGLDERLANAFDDLDGPALIIGMDTPQAHPDALEAAVDRLRGSDAVLGPALDGGYWAIGLRRADRHALVGVPMSTAGTYVAQRARLLTLGLRISEVHVLRDVDTFDDALAVARSAPGTRFAAALAATELDRQAA